MRRHGVSVSLIVLAILVLALIVPVHAGNTVSVSGEILATPASRADFSANPLAGNSPLLVRFIDQSTGTITSWAWDFQNDGVVDSRTRNPNFLYTRAGTYTVSLTVSGPGGTDRRVKTGYITVGPSGKPPVALFTQDKYFGKKPLTIRFTDHSKNNPAEYLWNFGDGSTSTQQNPVHTYTRAGISIVRLRVSNAFGSDTSWSMVWSF